MAEENPNLAEIEALSHQLEADRTAVAAGVTAISKTLDSFYWLVEGRGSYEWDDDRYQDEFKNAALKLKEQLAPLQKIAADWTGCPKTSKEVAVARIDKAVELERLREENARLMKGTHMAEETPKSPENSGEAKPVYVSKCLVCGHAMSVHGHEPDEHGYPYLPVTLEDVEMWRKSGDSEFTIEKRVLVRGKA